MKQDCEACGTPFQKVMGRGVANRITCYSCTDSNKKVSYRNKHLKKKYGITQFHFSEMFKEQEGKCKICSSEMNFMNGTPTKGVKRSGSDCCIDHDHKTGKVRGLLCFHCNTALGHLFDNIELLDNIKEYLSQK
jgi:hypothetical protein